MVTRKVHILCIADEADLLRTLRAELRLAFQGSHSLDMAEGSSEVVAFVGALLRSRDDLEVAVTTTGSVERHRSGIELLAGRFPSTKWVLIGDQELSPSEGTHLPTSYRVVPFPWRETALVDAVKAAIEGYRRAKREELAQALGQSDLFKALSPAQIRWLASKVEVRRYESGQVVVEAGERGDGLYIIRFGEVKVLGFLRGEEVELGRLGRHAHFGDMSLLTGQPRSATVMTTLDSELFFLRKEDFDELLRIRPELAIRLSQSLSASLRRMEREYKKTQRVIGCMSTLSDHHDWELALRLSRVIAAETGKRTVLLDLNLAHPFPLKPGLETLLDKLEGMGGQIPEDYLIPLDPDLWGLAADQGMLGEELLPHQLAPLFEALKGAFEFVVIAAGRLVGPDLFLKLINQSDLFLLAVARTEGSLKRGLSILEQIRDEAPAAEHKTALVLDIVPRSGTLTVDDLVQALKHPIPYKIALGDGDGEGSFPQVARQVIGIGVGLALGGGGARGFAHIGVLEVFQQEGIPIDLIGGTSMGAFIGALYAMGKSIPEIIEICRREWVETNPLSPSDYTIPKTAIYKGKKVDAMVRRVFGDIMIEDLPVNFCAIAADLVAGTEAVLDSGSLGLACRASASLPGIVKPVRLGKMYLVDGAIVNNVPGDVLKKRGARLVIAVNVTPQREVAFPSFPEEETKGSWFGQVLRRSPMLREFLDAPSILQIITRAINVEGMEIVRNRSRHFDVHLQPELDEFDLFDFRRLEAIVEKGREAARARVSEIKERVRSLVEEL
ncbi:MAG: patatin-like phospholipase family protein [candidate division NC10 bacterium]|nr:patatin-like phospholipase family protein [candidate division NC10 bacterium]